MRVTTDDYELGLVKTGEMVEITGSTESLECFRAGVELCGASCGAEGSSRVEVIREPTGDVKGALRATEGTVALWLSFEALNFL